MTPTNPYQLTPPEQPPPLITELRISHARLEERVDAVEADVADVRVVGVRLEGKLDRLTFAVVGAALSFAVGSGAVVAAVMTQTG